METQSEGWDLPVQVGAAELAGRVRVTLPPLTVCVSTARPGEHTCAGEPGGPVPADGGSDPPDGGSPAAAPVLRPVGLRPPGGRGLAGRWLPVSAHRGSAAGASTYPRILQGKELEPDSPGGRGAGGEAGEAVQGRSLPLLLRL